ncbi:hypothetical protein ACHAXS_008746 [Conticribra weissflogii]
MTPEGDSSVTSTHANNSSIGVSVPVSESEPLPTSVGKRNPPPFTDINQTDDRDDGMPYLMGKTCCVDNGKRGVAPIETTMKEYYKVEDRITSVRVPIEHFCNVEGNFSPEGESSGCSNAENSLVDSVHAFNSGDSIPKIKSFMSPIKASQNSDLAVNPTELSIDQECKDSSIDNMSAESKGEGITGKSTRAADDVCNSQDKMREKLESVGKPADLAPDTVLQSKQGPSIEEKKFCGMRDDISIDTINSDALYLGRRVTGQINSPESPKPTENKATPLRNPSLKVEQTLQQGNKEWMGSRIEISKNEFNCNCTSLEIIGENCSDKFAKRGDDLLRFEDKIEKNPGNFNICIDKLTTINKSGPIPEEKKFCGQESECAVEKITSDANPDERSTQACIPSAPTKSHEDKSIPHQESAVGELSLLPKNEESSDLQIEAADDPGGRYRTRSLSSAISSMSGEESTGYYFDNDGKTPLKTKRRKRTFSGDGPVKKRHKGLTLFNIHRSPVATSALKHSDGDTDRNANHEQSAKESQDLPISAQSHNNENMLDSMENTTRSRSNTIDSFRAAMGAHLFLSSETIILPDMKGDGNDDHVMTESVDEVSRDRSDTLDFLSRSNPASSQRPRSDTVDFLIGKNFEDEVEKEQIFRERSETMEFLTKSNPLDDYKRERSDTIEFLTKLNPIPTPRGRSDTVDFLASAIGDEIDNESGKHVGHVAHEREISIHATVKCDSSVDDISKNSHECEELVSANKIVDDAKVSFGKTPKKTNLSRKSYSQHENSILLHRPAKMRQRARSLSFVNSVQTNSSRSSADRFDEAGKGYDSQDNESEDQDDIATESENSGRRLRSNTLDSFHNIFGVRDRSDTMDFLTAAVAGDMGHDIDAAFSAAAGDGASFAMHPISAPSGATMNFARHQIRPRSDTIESNASSINSSKLDFLVSVAVEDGPLTFPSACRERTESGGGDSSEQVIHRRPRSDTLEIYSSMSSTRHRSDTVDFLIGVSEEPLGNIDHVIPIQEKGESNSNTNVMEHLKALCEEPKINLAKSTGILRRRLNSFSENGDHQPPLASHAKFDDKSMASKRVRANSEHTSKTNFSLDASTQKMLSDTIHHFQDEKRNRFESWGGMSDLSISGMGQSAIEATHSALKSTGIIDDLMAAVGDLNDDDELSEEHMYGKTIESTEGILRGGGTNSYGASGPQKGRIRVDSLASLSLASLSDASISIADTEAEKKRMAIIRARQVAIAPPKEIKTPSKSSSSVAGTPSITVDYDAIAAAVDAANAATEGLDLDAILNSSSATSPAKRSAITLKADKKSLDEKPNTRQQNRNDVDCKQVMKSPSKVTPPIQTETLIARRQRQKLTAQAKQAPADKEQATSVQAKAKLKPIPSSVERSSFSKNPSPSSTAPAIRSNPGIPVHLASVSSRKRTTEPQKPLMPYAVTSMPFVPIPKSTKTEEEMEAIRARARAAAGYVPPGQSGETPGKKPPLATPTKKTSKYLPPPHLGSHTPFSNIPLKKRGLPHPSYPPPGHFYLQTPQPYGKSPHFRPQRTPSSSNSKSSGVLQSQQKWDDMFECLVKFIEETRAEATKDMSEDEKKTWVWDGNVPTNYKTQCGKALGRWINNQRSAKAKGTLKDDREVRLVSTGLKWSVLTTNSWKDMLRELEIYVHEQTRNGRVWDGNVPTNYKIRSNISSDGTEIDEEKNLGRWINRQRSLFQAGKLKKERQLDLERIGLKWSVLLTTSWSTMYQSLVDYSEERRKERPDIGWDGNVPANYKTDSNPPLNLGRWVNRQRSAYAKGRLKDEFVQKLDSIGFKWVVHERKRGLEDDGDEDEDYGEEYTDSIQKNSKGTPTESHQIPTPRRLPTTSASASNEGDSPHANLSLGLRTTAPLNHSETKPSTARPNIAPPQHAATVTRPTPKPLIGAQNISSDHSKPKYPPTSNQSLLSPPKITQIPKVFTPPPVPQSVQLEPTIPVPQPQKRIDVKDNNSRGSAG